MNKYELFQAIGSISDEKLDEAISYHKEKKQNRLKKYAGLAASIGLISAGIFWGNYIKNEMHIYSNLALMEVVQVRKPHQSKIQLLPFIILLTFIKDRL